MTDEKTDQTPDPKPDQKPDQKQGAARWLPALIAVVAVVAVVGVVMGIRGLGGSDDNEPDRVDRGDPDRAAPGQVFKKATAGEKLPHVGVVVLPWIRLGVGASEPVDEVPFKKGADVVKAPADGSFVRVEVRKQGTVAFALSSKSPGDDVELLLRADGTDYSLTKPNGLEFDSAKPWLIQSRENRWVAVEGHPTDLQLVLRIGDVEQVVDASSGKADLDRAEALSKVPSPEQSYQPFPCGQASSTGASSPRNEVPCTVGGTLRTPYVDGLGWADDGHEFLVVNVTTGKKAALGAKQASIAGRTATLGGADPVDVLDRGKSTQFVFDVSEGKTVDDLTLEASYGADAENPDSVLEWSIAGSHFD